MDAPDVFIQKQHELAEITASINIAFTKQVEVLQQMYPTGIHVKARILRNQEKMSLAVVTDYMPDENGGKLGINVIVVKNKQRRYNQTDADLKRWVSVKDIILLDEAKS